MRLMIEHETRYRYDLAPVSVIEVLRLTPCNSDSQSIRDWRITVSGDAPLRRFEDAFGNVNHTFTTPVGANEDLVVTATGTVDTSSTNGVISGTRERLPLPVFLRETDLTLPSPEIVALGEEARNGASGLLDTAHRLNGLINERVKFVTGSTNVATHASDALIAGEGVCQDLTHIILATARAVGLPARYVSGYQFASGQARDEHAGHAWAEIHIEDLGWVGFDPTAGGSTDDTYVRVAIGLDHFGASPVRGATYGGAGETLDVNVTMDPGGRRPGNTGSQSQTQSSQSQSQ
ncbi:transglutaminase family protein [Acuticoccus sp. MNP-M23]|uniref:transglutaminase family protein n=1 Tax=Acuticoccus sp. MNP-M23 TaxID=3072793 RepID=UPI002815AA8A|nr:transglutaminase family protein [Acuticoccus sp. MNP-M23]WMS43032.1 transglutaminase family protein [Acuticoccus sp. MNP-M23]